MNEGARERAGKVLDIVSPDFDEIDWYATFTVHIGSLIVVLLTIRIALLAGLFRTRTKPTLFDRMQSCAEDGVPELWSSYHRA
ncbi:MAG TPA: hypothetical protein PKX13_13920 [Acidiphilium sp.]|nr:hypothetical protein [Acidiphilium sp.]